MTKLISNKKGKKTTKIIILGSILLLITVGLILVRSKSQELQTLAAHDEAEPALQLKAFYVTLALAPPPDKSLCTNASIFKNRTWGWGTRIVLINDCVEIRGKVTRQFEANDGDVHIDVIVDPAYQWQVAGRTKITAEIVCQHLPKGPRVRRVCAGYTNSILKPKVGDHIRVIGPYVDDEYHGRSEMHPVYSLKVL